MSASEAEAVAGLFLDHVVPMATAMMAPQSEAAALKGSDALLSPPLTELQLPESRAVIDTLRCLWAALVSRTGAKGGTDLGNGVRSTKRTGSQVIRSPGPWTACGQTGIQEGGGRGKRGATSDQAGGEGGGSQGMKALLVELARTVHALPAVACATGLSSDPMLSPPLPSLPYVVLRRISLVVLHSVHANINFKHIINVSEFQKVTYYTGLHLQNILTFIYKDPLDYVISLVFFPCRRLLQI